MSANRADKLRLWLLGKASRLGSNGRPGKREKCTISNLHGSMIRRLIRRIWKENLLDLGSETSFGLSVRSDGSSVCRVSTSFASSVTMGASSFLGGRDSLCLSLTTAIPSSADAFIMV